MIIKINTNSRIPKYQQIVNSIIDNIRTGTLKIDQKIPSINGLSEDFDLSRDTVEKAYNILKERKIISSIRGKGYYVTRTKLISKINILFLINKLSSYKMNIYNSFINNIGNNSHTDLHIYHCDESLFINTIDKNLGAYDYYIIMPHFKTDNLKHISFSNKILATINKIPKEKLVIMDNNNLNLKGAAIEVYQDFENDIYNGLKGGLSKIKKYNRLILAYPESIVYPYPRRILHGFRKFCAEFSIESEVLDEIYEDIILKKGDLFITIEESDLVNLIKQVRDNNLQLGKDIGIISYNETPLKELLGITVISTDFKKMGMTAANMILDNEKGKVKNPFNLIYRKSL
ncbi:GntR family transcriptional regulator [Cellulophaga sp. F20128]|uniref:GntR family transcriptional regulator n=1 Tax=Cellulophaga sp. F20128 TaxID=2926413 RepID=UPI001FF1FE9C|nr:GntR family transcriptional regulator [Cellulophaga sp. F20128]MCK0156448.1 GntR family transcriptional regulator [Cellulophaga sp. F20128]